MSNHIWNKEAFDKKKELEKRLSLLLAHKLKLLHTEFDLRKKINEITADIDSKYNVGG
tara:strand:- start:258 stop:431 length:174 start_codon:yes stop_codon:yes gene_type:complete